MNSNNYIIASDIVVIFCSYSEIMWIIAPVLKMLSQSWDDLLKKYLFFICLFIWKAGLQKEGEAIFTLVHFPNGCQNQGSARPKPAASLDSLTDGSGPSTWAISHCFPWPRRGIISGVAGLELAPIWNAAALSTVAPCDQLVRSAPCVAHCDQQC